MTPVDIDVPASWPPHIYRAVSAWAAQCAGKTRYTNDLPLDLELESPFRRELAGFFLRAYHYTKLLAHEREMIQRRGLRPLTVELLGERIDAARTSGDITADEAGSFHKGHVFAAGEHIHREGQVCLVLSERLFEREPDACLPLLSNWGGEALYMSSGSVLFRPQLGEIGTPTRVTALVALDDASHAIYPALHKVFVGSLLGLSDVGADVFYRASVPPDRIESIDEIESFDQDR
jgi:hypothetical protein